MGYVCLGEYQTVKAFEVGTNPIRFILVPRLMRAYPWIEELMQMRCGPGSGLISSPLRLFRIVFVVAKRPCPVATHQMNKRG